MEEKKADKSSGWSFDVSHGIIDFLSVGIINSKILGLIKNHIKGGVLEVKDKVELQALYDYLKENMEKIPDTLQKPASELLEKIADAISNEA